jgi:hypothetical protein
VNISLFECSDAKGKRDGFEACKEVITSGAYLDVPCGVTTGLKTLKPGKYWAIPSTYAVGTDASWEVIIHHSKHDVQVQDIQ